MTDFIARQERFALIPSTNDVVRDWLAGGTSEVCLAIADAQSAGRGRLDRTWTAPAGAALLLSLGFRPTWLAADRIWQLAAVVSMAMAEAAETVLGMADRTIRLKWPNDLVVETIGPAIPPVGGHPTEIRKLAGVLAESVGLGGPDPQVVVGLGLNTDWDASAFPAGLATSMTSLRAATGSGALDHAALLSAFIDRLEGRIEALRAGRFDEVDWADRQSTPGRDVDLVGPDGTSRTVRAVGVHTATGALLIRTGPDDPTDRAVVVADIGRVRIRSVDPASGATLPASPIGL
jgi:BirA family biotin operon repressor/biotin-[acetyl-CoA-carboxylase] ligase